LTETLLKSPAFAQTWARRWLDLSRYAESAGFQDDSALPMAWRYRDFVVQALQTNQRFDEFLRWQIAGDRLAPQRPEASIATGFLALGPYQSPVTVSELEQARYDELDDFLQTIGTGMLGLTIGCARCHDHKYDPLPAADYYALAACFTTTTRGLRDIQPRSQAELAAAREWSKQESTITAELTSAEAKAKATEKLRASVNDAKLAPAFSARLREVGETGLADLYDQVRGGFLMEQVGVGYQRSMQAQFARWTSPDYEAVWQRMQAHLKSKPASPPLLLTLTEEFGGLNEHLRRHMQGPNYFRISFQLNRGDPKQKQREATPGLACADAPGASVSAGCAGQLPRSPFGEVFPPSKAARRPASARCETSSTRFWQRPRHARPVAHGCGKGGRTTGRPRHREPALELAFWPGHRWHAERLRLARRAAHAPRAARMARG
jgi:hypothetical protein